MEKAVKKRSSESCPAQYSVYIHHPADASHDCKSWERKHITTDVNKALARAKILCRSNDYERVEVKKTVCDHETDRNIDVTYKVFERVDPQRSYWAETIIAGVVCGAALAFFL